MFRLVVVFFFSSLMLIFWPLCFVVFICVHIYTEKVLSYTKQLQILYPSVYIRIVFSSSSSCIMHSTLLFPFRCIFLLSLSHTYTYILLFSFVSNEWLYFSINTTTPIIIIACSFFFLSLNWCCCYVYVCLYWKQ